MFHVELMSKAKPNKILQATDYLVSREIFNIHWDDERQIAWTDVQHLETLDPYYESSEYISHQSKPHSLIQQLYVRARSLMLNYKYMLLKKHINSNSHILDVGCGTGSFLSYMRKKGCQVHGVEKNAKARNICLENNLDVETTETNLSPNSFDAITLWHVLEHLPKPEMHLSNYLNLLKSNGILAIAVPNFESHDLIYYQNAWAALDVPRHLWHFTPNGLINMANQNGFELIKKKPLRLDVFYISYLSEKNVGKSFPLLRGILKGMGFSLKTFFTSKHSSWVYVFKKQTL